MCYMKRTATEVADAGDCATLCYMKGRATKKPATAKLRRRVNVRELRQNLSKYLVDVKGGEAIEVAERGEPVAMLGPLPKPTSIVERLIAEGRLLPARLRLEDIGPPLPPVPGPTLSEILEEMRSEDD